ncbi:hypothetical protein JGUZn3_13970 [Entomobacter blattae]|uniref:Uncharacterized protein n=1 Tax=Entomobacter blattae TaxID=2762277 RepID=A0A7H1NS62_9PROT|nr:hypothetical protein JGUZn3_13970 [Entomobacter blattae]
MNRKIMAKKAKKLGVVTEILDEAKSVGKSP